MLSTCCSWGLRSGSGRHYRAPLGTLKRMSDISPGASRWPRGSASSCLHSTRRRWRRARSPATAASRCGSRASSASTTSRRASTSSPSRTRCSSSCPCSRGSRPRRGRCACAPGILLLTLLNPVEVAENAATLDAITDGRFVLGLGLGYRQEENDAFGLPEKRLRRVRAEARRRATRCSRARSVTAEGHGFRLHDQQLALRPTQTPRPPIWLAANNDNAVLRAARLADAWLLNPHTKLYELERQLGLYHAERERCGLPPAAEIPIIKELHVGSDDESAMRAVRPYLEDKYKAYVQWGQSEVLPRGRHAAAGLRPARAGRPLHRRRPRELRPPGARARRAPRRDELPLPLPVAGHAAGAGARLDAARRRGGLPAAFATVLVPELNARGGRDARPGGALAAGLGPRGEARDRGQRMPVRRRRWSTGSPRRRRS